jgi:S1-C subfamily serine protease
MRATPRLGIGLALLVHVGNLARAELVPDSLLPLPLTNGPEVRRALEGLAGQTLPSSGWLELASKKPLAAVTFVGQDGYFLTKASEITRMERCFLKTSAEAPRLSVREVRRDVKLDLALGQVVAPDSPLTFLPVKWSPAAAAGLGTWICSPGAVWSAQAPAEHRPELRLGVVSAATRAIPGEGAALGIRMATQEEQTGPDADKGVVILGVAAESPAQAAGLKRGDVLVEIAGQAVADFKQVNDLVKNRQPGDEIAIKLLREGKEVRKRLRLASRSRVIANWDGDDYANGGISIRTDQFPRVIQHDLPLNPHDMGGPVFNLQGEAIAINIARADRITTFALPTELFRAKLEQWLEADRHPPKAQPSSEN